MSKAPTKTSSGRDWNSVKRPEDFINGEKSRDNADPDAPVLPPEMWDNAIIGKYYRLMKTQISFRVDNDVLEWMKTKGEGYLTRINEILRERMMGERK